MNNRDVEVVILKKIQELNKKFHTYCSVDLKTKRDLLIPRVVSRTNLNKVMNTLNETENIDNDYVGHKEITVIKHYIQLNFVLDKNMSFQDVEKIRLFLKHKIGTRHYFLLNGINLIIKNVGDIVELSEQTSSGYLEKYTFDVEITSIEKHTEKIEIVKDVKFKVNRR